MSSIDADFGNKSTQPIKKSIRKVWEIHPRKINKIMMFIIN